MKFPCQYRAEEEYTLGWGGRLGACIEAYGLFPSPFMGPEDLQSPHGLQSTEIWAQGSSAQVKECAQIQSVAELEPKISTIDLELVYTLKLIQIKAVCEVKAQ